MYTGIIIVAAFIFGAVAYRLGFKDGLQASKGKPLRGILNSAVSDARDTIKDLKFKSDAEKTQQEIAKEINEAFNTEFIIQHRK